MLFRSDGGNGKLGIALAIGLVEAALGQAHVDRHLTAFEAIDRNTTTGFLTFDTATRRLAFTGADTAADPLALFSCAGIV